ncbi:BTAD domain-containing putative transcriptional regulator [Pseudonocardia acaciae]|uniref:BTAD domain-containing putative transcriptional regulator n=1 Tax=Pseudonocardia acaciae TaxID=551276 RepID=UPI0004915902|nr:BTAD domain-containing putative transcriptional regulator [Pseudonocardia acaciae]
MRFGILGPLLVTGGDGAPVTLGSRKARALVALLVLDAGRVVTVDRLLHAVYGGAPPAGAANALQAHVSRIRRRLGADAALVEFHPGGYRLAVRPEEVDAHEFARLADAGREALAGGEHAAAADRLRTALGLWRGRALADLDDAPGVAAELDERWVEASEDLVDAELALGSADGLVARLRAMVAAHPLRERPRALLVRALAAQGRDAEALAAFEEARATLADELGADPSPELRRAHLDVLAQAGGPRPRPLPQWPNAFVGRERELDELASALKAHRLVTVTGPGGIGKTRLAVAGARRHPGPARFADLSPVTEPEGVIAALRSALGLRDDDGPHLAHVRAALAEGPSLLVLDNCEHVVEAAAEVVHRLLAGCPELRVLATSREPLAIDGEAPFAVPTLPVPAAVALFASRSGLASAPDTASDTGSDTASGETMARICAALDGLPLAIELAAARARALPLDELARRLDDRFTLLSRKRRAAAPARHATLHAVVAWSWELLDDGERATLSRLSVFAGGATVAAVERVCGPPDPVPALASLVDRSLVQLADGRYRMLETIRLFAARLLDADEAERLRRGHAEHHLALANRADPRLRGGDQLEWLARLDAELDNLRAALRWAVANDPVLALRLCGALAMYWWLRGHGCEAGATCAELANRIGPRPPESLAEEYALCVLTAAGAGADLGEHLDALNSLAATWTEPPRQPMLTVLWARLAGPRPDGRLAPPPDALLDSDPWNHALRPLSDGLRALHLGRADDAERALRRALERFRVLGERWGLVKTLAELAELTGWRGRRDQALAYLDEAVELSVQLGAPEDTAELLCRRAEWHARSGTERDAENDLRRALAIAARTGAAARVARAHGGLAELARLRGDLATARAEAARALADTPAPGIRPPEAHPRALVTLGLVAAAVGELDEAADRLRGALDGRHALIAATATEAVAGLAVARNEHRDAARLLGAAVALRGLPVDGDPTVARVAGAVRGRLDGASFDDLYRAGASLTQDQALTLAARACQ